MPFKGELCSCGLSSPPSVISEPRHSARRYVNTKLQQVTRILSLVTCSPFSPHTHQSQWSILTLTGLITTFPIFLGTRSFLEKATKFGLLLETSKSPSPVFIQHLPSRSHYFISIIIQMSTVTSHNGKEEMASPVQRTV